MHSCVTVIDSESLPLYDSSSHTGMATKGDSAELSKLYLACRNGDVEYVRTYLQTSSDTAPGVNRLETQVNSTPLHAASYYGHKEIVRLLLEHGCDRHQINRYGMTAYQEAANDEIRQLFKRPTTGDNTRRFLDDSVEDCFDFVKRPDEDERGTVTPPQATKTKKPSVQTYKTKVEKETEIGYATTSIAMCQSKLGRFITDRFQRDAPMSWNSIGAKLQEIIDQEVIATKDPQSRRANELLNHFLSSASDERIDQLIRLYTLETRFYGALKQNPIPLALPLYMRLQTLKERYFEGQSYRGAKMTHDEIVTYEWAAQNRGSLLQTKHFSSTSILRSVAEEFANAAVKQPAPVQHCRVLFTFRFADRCDQAINLSRISDTLPCLSEYENESEVLILPWTLFEVDSVQEESPLAYNIVLVNITLPQKSLGSSLKWILKHPKGSIKRFHENFPEKQPEHVVKQLLNNSLMFEQNHLREKEVEHR